MSPAFHDSPTVASAEFINTLPLLERHTHNTRYRTALEEEHSRDLYLQGVIAVGQIARLLEELCGDIYAADDHGEEDGDDVAKTPIVCELSAHLSEAVGIHDFLSHEKRDHIAAWARAVSAVDDMTRGQAQPPYDADGLDMEDGDATYLRGALVVGDIADLLDDLLKGLSDRREGPGEDDDDCEINSCVAFSFREVALAQISAPEPPSSSSLSLSLSSSIYEIPDFSSEFAARLSCLSARLAKLETDIDAFLQERSDALRRMELDDDIDSGTVAGQASDKQHDWSRCGEVVRDVDIQKLYNNNYPDDALDICRISENEESLLIINRVWTTTTDTATSGFSLVTPSGSDIQPVDFEQAVKDYFWD